MIGSRICYHRRKAVAPLKVEIAAVVLDGPSELPSPKGGGPIGGARTSRQRRRTAWLPSPKGGGPIEGSRNSGPSRPGSSSYHRRKAVAPLKDIAVRCHPQPTVRYHRRKAVAPLKVSTLTADGGLLWRYHRRKAVAPLKDDGRCQCRAGVRRYHRRKAVAPLKGRQTTVPQHRGHPQLPSPKGGGPIEGASNHSASTSRTSTVTIAERRWPH